MTLANKKCMPCEGGVAPLSVQQAQVLLAELKYWKLAANARGISKTYKFKDWQLAHAFVDSVSEIAESENHHPHIELDWGRVVIELSTHSIDGLSENDFILAAKIDALT